MMYSGKDCNQKFTCERTMKHAALLCNLCIIMLFILFGMNIYNKKAKGLMAQLSAGYAI